MPDRLEPYLWDIRDAGGEIIDLTASLTLADYVGTRVLQLAVERCFITIGEAMARIRDHFPVEYLRLSHGPRVIAFRNHLTHRYDAVSDDEVWRIIQLFLDPLLQEVAALLESLRA